VPIVQTEDARRVVHLLWEMEGTVCLPVLHVSRCFLNYIRTESRLRAGQTFATRFLFSNPENPVRSALMFRNAG